MKQVLIRIGECKRALRQQEELLSREEKYFKRKEIQEKIDTLNNAIKVLQACV